MSKPTKYLDFALEDEIDEKSGQNNKIEIPDKYIRRGFFYHDPVPRNYINEFFNGVGLWIRHLDSQIGGSGGGGGDLKLKSYTLSTLPSAGTSGAGSLIYVSNATGGGLPCFSDGTNWLRVTDKTQVD